MNKLSIETSHQLIVMGQDDYVKRVCSYYDQIYHNEIKCVKFVFPLVTDKSDNNVFDFDSCNDFLQKLEYDVVLFIAFSVKVHRQIQLFLNKKGFHNLFFYTPAVDNKLKKEYFSKYFEEQGERFNYIYEMDNEGYTQENKVELYMTKCIVDKPLVSFPNSLPQCVIQIQAGAALTDKRIATVTDDIGDNISSRNRRYSEMTAAYWAWKHSKADFIGLCHYRRHFVDLGKIVSKLNRINIDIVLPLPTLYETSIYKDHLMKYTPTVYKVMLAVLDEYSPEYYDSALNIYDKKIFIANNMWIVRKTVLDDLFSWLFPILFEIEKRIGELEDSYYNRYAGFCAEQLTGLYFLYNKRNWKIAYAEKMFLY
ncbi:DUF4422 domain-containing protein [Pectinatus haikarae]|uniref:DUF4422 domain-containing protein n=1 Tax=Pectinatus haikarae TaxID=349096 RepID=UPI0018C6827B|nr:DUF4422 domain-containing protein [Pectinatus haikarae]